MINSTKINKGLYLTQNDKKSNVVEFPLKDGTSFRTEKIQQPVSENPSEASISPKTNALDLERDNFFYPLRDKTPLRGEYSSN